jgi:hypothetical protein
MPLLGEPVEPSRVERVAPWWRALAALEKGEVPKSPEDAAAEMGQFTELPID